MCLDICVNMFREGCRKCPPGHYFGISLSADSFSRVLTESWGERKGQDSSWPPTPPPNASGTTCAEDTRVPLEQLWKQSTPGGSTGSKHRCLGPREILAGTEASWFKNNSGENSITLVERKFLKQKSNKKKDIPPECKKNYTPQLWRGQNEHWIYSGNTQFPKKEKDEDAGKDPGRKGEKRKKKKKKKKVVFFIPWA